jgi:tryptophan-rich hypothetical protein
MDEPSATPPPPRLNPKKLLLSKWTAVQPVAKEKHFIVTRLVQPDDGVNPPAPITDVVIEAVHSGRSSTMAWRDLTDTTRWRQGWR